MGRLSIESRGCEQVRAGWNHAYFQHSSFVDEFGRDEVEVVDGSTIINCAWWEDTGFGWSMTWSRGGGVKWSTDSGVERRLTTSPREAQKNHRHSFVY